MVGAQGKGFVLTPRGWGAPKPEQWLWLPCAREITNSGAASVSCWLSAQGSVRPVLGLQSFLLGCRCLSL
jgi:hypothetical protein